jgi:hypothetical protein
MVTAHCPSVSIAPRLAGGVVRKDLWENETKIRRAFRLPQPKAPSRSRATWPVVALYAVITGALTTLSDRMVIWWKDALVTSVAVLIAVPTVAIAYSLAMESYERRQALDAGEGRLRVLYHLVPLAAAMALASRIFHLVPPYVYGLILAYSIVRNRRLNANQKAVAVLRAALVLAGICAVSLAAWQFGTSHLPVRTNFALRVLDATLGIITIIGLEALVIRLLPLRFMDRIRLWRWSPARRVRNRRLRRLAGPLLWLLVFSTLTTLTAIAVLGLGTYSSSLHEIEMMIILFGAFATGSVTFWGSSPSKDG